MNSSIPGLESLQGVPKTLCIPLLARARTKDLTPHLTDFDDPTAREWVTKIGVDPTWIEGDSMILKSCIVRARRLDEETRRFLAEDPSTPATILSVGAGLCSRMDRLHLTSEIQGGSSKLNWVDLDLPEVIDLRSRIRPAQGGHSYINKSLADPSWMQALPEQQGRRVLILIEGVFVYLSSSVIRSFLQDTTRFLHAAGARQIRFAFDLLDGPALSGSRASPSIRNAGARLAWAPWSLENFLQSTNTSLKLLRRVDLIRDLHGVLPFLHHAYLWMRGNPVYSVAVVEAEMNGTKELKASARE